MILSNIGWILINFDKFCTCHWKWMKVGQTLLRNSAKVHSFEQSFSWSKTFSWNKISSHFVLLMTEIFHFTSISHILSAQVTIFCTKLVFARQGWIILPWTNTCLLQKFRNYRQVHRLQRTLLHSKREYLKS